WLFVRREGRLIQPRVVKSRPLRTKRGCPAVGWAAPLVTRSHPRPLLNTSSCPPSARRDAGEGHRAALPPGAPLPALAGGIACPVELWPAPGKNSHRSGAAGKAIPAGSLSGLRGGEDQAPGWMAGAMRRKGGRGLPLGDPQDAVAVG